MKKYNNELNVLGYLQRNRVAISIISLLTILIHGSKLFSVNVGIDTEQIIYSKDALYESWNGIGRYGLILLKVLMGQSAFNPLFAGMLMILFLIVGVIAFGFVFSYVSGECQEKEGILLFLFSMTVIAHPIITEQFYFSLQGAEVSLSFVLCAVSLLLAHLWCENKEILCFIGSVILLPVIFSVYQSFVPLYIFGVVAMCCLYLPEKEDYSVNMYLKYIGKHIAIFLCGFLGNQLITKLFFVPSGYLAGQISWDIHHIGLSFRHILSHMYDVLVGVEEPLFPDVSFIAIACLLLILWLSVFFEKKDVKRSVLNLILLAALYLSPFYLTIVLGERPVPRAQLVLPFTTGFMFYLTGVLLQRCRMTCKPVWQRSVKIAFCIICITCIWQEADITSRLYYTDAVRYQRDVSLAEEIRSDIAKFTGKIDYDGKVVFVGEMPISYSDSCLTGDVMGQSFFAWDTDVEPLNYWSSGRIIGFMSCIGCNYQKPTTDEAKAATAVAADMPCYPQDGSILSVGDIIVVKLSEE